MLLKKGFSNKNHLSKKLHNQYIKPFPDNESRTPLLDLAKALIGASSWYQQQWQKLDILSDKEWLILWGSKDEFITMDYLAKWKQRLPQAKTIEFDCGHFVQEEKTEDSIKRIASFLE